MDIYSSWPSGACLPYWVIIGLDHALLPVSHQPIIYRQVSNISGTVVGNNIADHSHVVEALPVGAAPTTSSFST